MAITAGMNDQMMSLWQLNTDGCIFCQVVGESEIWRLYAELTNSLPGQTAETQQKVVV